MNNQSFECRPRHGSLPLVPLVLLLPVSCTPGLVDWTGTAEGLVELAGHAAGTCSCAGGKAIGDFERREASRERLRERPRMHCVIAPKKSRDTGDVGDVGDAGGDRLPDD